MRLVGSASRWELPQVELFMFEAPSEALARIAQGHTSVFLFDTRDYPRHRHVERKFFSMNTDADLVLLGQSPEDALAAEAGRTVAVRALPEDTPHDEIQVVVQRLLQLRDVRQNSGIYGRSRSIAEMLGMIAHAAPLDINVLVLGESGTGKELVARAIHDNSPRRAAPFISLNCGAMSEGVLESELFGHVKGAFTGAVADHEGVFKRADGGTLFLDEVGEMPLSMQTRFLRALETGEFTPVGGRGLIKSHIRLVAATHQDLAGQVKVGKFRQDLYYRLRVVVIHTPSLRDHPEDIPILAERFLAEENKRHGLHVRGFSRSALQTLRRHSWPGNVRELRNTISSTVAMKQRGLVEVEDLPATLNADTDTVADTYLPVPFGLNAGASSIDPGLLAHTLLEIKQELREVKALLQERDLQADGAIPWPPGQGGRIYETFSADSGFSPLDNEKSGDLQTAEKALIEEALNASGGNRRKAAERLGISERTLYRKIKAYGFS
ncbi:sigma-54-dependent Fis family transcriptional regulator [bacterium DOLZORAL124_64_63]|nr:MAG: sigma-54-dependent Fis family transcriptional regulator [bacterium DOLZORAL124_64_63]